MPIAPLQIRALQIPDNPDVRVPINFSWLGNLGEAIGQERLRNQIAGLTVTDAAGNVDFDKTTAALTRAGLLPQAEQFMTASARRQALGQQAATLAETKRAHKAQEDYLRSEQLRKEKEFELGKQETISISGTNPDTEEKETSHILRRTPEGLFSIYKAPWAPDIPGVKPLVPQQPAAPNAPAVAPAPVIKPQSSIFDESQLAPYRVAAAGAMPPPPQQGVPATTEPVERVAQATQATELPAITPSRKKQ